MTSNIVENIPFPRLSAEVYSIPLGDERFLIYAPLRRAAFVDNAVRKNFLKSQLNNYKQYEQKTVKHKTAPL